MMNKAKSKKINENKKKYDVNFIKNKSQKFFKEKNHKIENFYIDEISKISIENISNYHGGFRARFFYGIYNFETKKGWIRLHGTSQQEFLILISIIEEGFYDLRIGNLSGVFANKTNIEKWHYIRNKKELFKNYSKNCGTLEELEIYLLNIGFGYGLFKEIFGVQNHYISGIIDLKEFFFSQLKALTSIRTNDKDINNFKSNYIFKDYYYNACYDNLAFENKFGYGIKQREIKKYYIFLKYFGKENKVMLYLSTSNVLELSSKGIFVEELQDKIFYGVIIARELAKFSNSKNINFSQRVKFMKDLYNKLFPGEQFFRF